MAENSGQQRGKPFRKGQSGNPAGRPSGYAEFKEKCRAKDDKALNALESALGDPDHAVAAAKVLLEFGWGKPAQSVEVSGPDGGGLQVIINKLPRETA